MKQEKINKKIFQVLSYLIKKELHTQNTVTFFREIDCTAIQKIRLQYRLRNMKKLSYTAFVAKAVSEAVLENKYANARVFPGIPYTYIHQFPEIHTAIACEKDNLGAEFLSFIDVIRNTDHKTIDEIHRELNQLTKANPENNEQLKSFLSIIKNCPLFLAKRLCALPTFFPSLWSKYRGASIIISSPAKYGVDCISGTWHYPIGISFGLVKNKPIVKNNKVETASCFTLTMNWDRRIMAGAPAARFLNSIAQNLESYERLISHLEIAELENEYAVEKIIALV